MIIIFTSLTLFLYRICYNRFYTKIINFLLIYFHSLSKKQCNFVNELYCRDFLTEIFMKCDLIDVFLSPTTCRAFARAYNLSFNLPQPILYYFASIWKFLVNEILSKLSFFFPLKKPFIVKNFNGTCTIHFYLYYYFS